MSAGPDLSQLSHAQKDALITTLMAELAAMKLGLAKWKPTSACRPRRQIIPVFRLRRFGRQRWLRNRKARQIRTPERIARFNPPDIRPDRFGLHVPRLRSRRFQRAASHLSGLLPDRNLRSRARRDARDVARRRLPLLRRAFQGDSARGSGAGIAIRAEPARLCDLSTLGPGHPDGAADRSVERSVRLGHQPRRAQKHPRRRARGFRGPDEPDQTTTDGQHGAGERRNRNAGGQGHWWLWVFHHGDSAAFVAEANRSNAVVENSWANTGRTCGCRIAWAARSAGPSATINSAARI